MLQPRGRRHPPTSLPDPARRALWGLALLDLTAVAWMLIAGAELDRISVYTAVLTLGGHHTVVLVLALIGVVGLVGLAALTRGFTSVTRTPRVLTMTACAVSVVAVSGVLLGLGLLLVAALLLGLLLRLFIRR